MKARRTQGYGGGGPANLQQLARQAQKMQEQMEAVTAELEEKEYSATAGGDAVKAIVTGKMEVKSIEIKPEVIDPDDAEMLGDLVPAAVNEALRTASQEKEERPFRRHEHPGAVLRWPAIMCHLWRSWLKNSKACQGSGTNLPRGLPTMCWA